MNRSFAIWRAIYRHSESSDGSYPAQYRRSSHRSTSRPRTAVVVSHVRSSGPAHHLVSFTKQHFDRVLEVQHPLIHSHAAKSTWRLWQGGVVIAEGGVSSRLPENPRYIADVLLTIWWIATQAGRSELYIGLGALSGAAGLIARRSWYCRMTVTWLIDYSPQRFSSPILDRLFHAIDAVVALRSDETWNISGKVIEAHISNKQLLRRRPNIQRVVPIGVDRILDPLRPHREDELIFVGHVLEKQGLQLVLEALPSVLSVRPGVRLTVVGDGPYLAQLKNRASELGISSIIAFEGFVASDEEIWQKLSRASIGIAPYLKTSDSFTNYADPGKVKQYLAAGLPICMTRVPPIAADIERRNCGVVVEDNVDSVRTGLLSLLGDAKLSERRRACVTFATEFTWPRVWSDAFVGIL